MKDLSVWNMFATKEQKEAEKAHQEKTKEMFIKIIPRLKCNICGAPANYYGEYTQTARCSNHKDNADSYQKI
jgi:hypothetical protein